MQTQDIAVCAYVNVNTLFTYAEKLCCVKFIVF